MRGTADNCIYPGVCMALRTSNGNGRVKSQQAFEKISSKQILDTLRAWQNENVAINSKALLKA